MDAAVRRDIITIGASAGGLEALSTLCAGLPADLPASVLIVMHMAPSSPSHLARLLARTSTLPVRVPADGELLQSGCVYVSTPDHHLLLRPGRVLVRRGPRESRSRPSVNALFRSAAVAYGARVIGVVLTGDLDDGTQGLVIIKQAGGMSVVQAPEDALHASMPTHALLHDHVDHAVPMSEMPALLSALVRQPAGSSQILTRDIAAEDAMAAQDTAGFDTTGSSPGEASVIGCPDCGGVLNVLGDKGALRYRCQIGHAYTLLGLRGAQRDELERALLVAIRTQRDRTSVYSRLEQQAIDHGRLEMSQQWAAAGSRARKLGADLAKALSDALEEEDVRGTQL